MISWGLSPSYNSVHILCYFLKNSVASIALLLKIEFIGVHVEGTVRKLDIITFIQAYKQIRSCTVYYSFVIDIWIYYACFIGVCMEDLLYCENLS